MNRGPLDLVRVAPSQGVDSVIEPLLTAKQVAAILGVNSKRVYELAIPCVRVSARALRYRPSDLAEFIQRRRRLP